MIRSLPEQNNSPLPAANKRGSVVPAKQGGNAPFQDLLKVMELNASLNATPALGISSTANLASRAEAKQPAIQNFVRAETQPIEQQSPAKEMEEPVRKRESAPKVGEQASLAIEQTSENNIPLTPGDKEEPSTKVQSSKKETAKAAQENSLPKISSAELILVNPRVADAKIEKPMQRDGSSTSLQDSGSSPEKKPLHPQTLSSKLILEQQSVSTGDALKASEKLGSAAGLLAQTTAKDRHHKPEQSAKKSNLVFNEPAKSVANLAAGAANVSRETNTANHIPVLNPALKSNPAFAEFAKNIRPANDSASPAFRLVTNRNDLSLNQTPLGLQTNFRVSRGNPFPGTGTQIEQILKQAKIQVFKEGNAILTTVLNPKELGRITVTLILQDGVLNGKLVVGGESVLREVQIHVDRMLQDLRANGQQIGKISVEVDPHNAAYSGDSHSERNKDGDHPPSEPGALAGTVSKATAETASSEEGELYA